MQLSIEKYPDIITSKQLMLSGGVLACLLLFLSHFYFMPHVVKFVFSRELGAKYQSMYFSDANDAALQFNIGHNFFFGENVIKSQKQAHYWYEKSAIQGYPKAQSMLARFYMINRKSKVDYNLGKLWLDRAIAQNDSYAFSLKGWCFYKGTCEEQSDKQAAFYFLKAASLGDAYAHSVLGYYYENELGGLKYSLDKTIFHYELADKLGIKGANKQLARVRKQKLKTK